MICMWHSKTLLRHLRSGIPSLHFMPFAEGGRSIGLPLCHRLLKDMGGLLSYAYENDHLIFTVSLPKMTTQRLRRSRR